MLICSFEVTSGSPTESLSSPALTSPSPPLQWAKTLSTGLVFLTFFPSLLLLPSSYPSNAIFIQSPLRRENDLLLRLEKSICSYRDHKNIILFLPILAPPLLTDHMALGVLPGCPEQLHARREDKILSWPFIFSESSGHRHTRGVSFPSILIVFMKHTVPADTIPPLGWLSGAKSIHQYSWLRSWLEGPNVLAL